MTINFTGNLTNQKISIDFANRQGKIIYYLMKPTEIDNESIFLLLNNSKIVGMDFGALNNGDKANSFIEIVVPENIIAADFFYCLTKEIVQIGYRINVDYKMTISEESKKVFQEYWRQILPLLQAFGLKSVSKRRSIKPRHKFLKSLSDVPFKIDYKGSKATVYWLKRNEFVVKAGATLVAEPPLTKAGIIGFAGKFGLQLRQEYEKQIKDNILIEDISLRSVNEIGTFLYFVGTNSWLQLKSPEGKTLDELTIVK
ncbi:MAG TPA: hypothetical protein DEQ50_09055 [Lactobacillus sp.]|nr:hypothetical protein [Lactobacillus sp.]